MYSPFQRYSIINHTLTIFCKLRLHQFLKNIRCVFMQLILSIFSCLCYYLDSLWVVTIDKVVCSSCESLTNKFILSARIITYGLFAREDKIIGWRLQIDSISRANYFYRWKRTETSPDYVLESINETKLSFCFGDKLGKN